MSRKEKGLAILVVLVVVVVVLYGFYLFLGVSHARGDSQYTGVVVDVEEDSGYIWKTTEVHIRTSEYSSETETFCVHPTNEDEQVPTFRQALKDGERVTVTYNRPLYVPRQECQAGLSIVQNVTVHDHRSLSPD